MRIDLKDVILEFIKVTSEAIAERDFLKEELKKVTLEFRKLSDNYADATKGKWDEKSHDDQISN